MRSTEPAKAPVAEPVDGQLDRHLELDFRDVVGRHHRLQFHLAEVDDREQRRVEIHLLARLHVAFGQGARHWRSHDRIAQGVSGELDLRFIGLQRALRDRKVALGAVVGILRDEALRQQRTVLGPRLFGERELRATRLERADAIGQLGFEIGGIEARQHLASFDGFAFADEYLTNISRDLRLYRGLIDGLQCARDRQPARQLA